MVGTLASPVRLWPYSRVVNVHWGEAVTHVAVALNMPRTQAGADLAFYPQQECDPAEHNGDHNFAGSSTLSSITYRYAVGDTYGRHQDGSWHGTPSGFRLDGFVGNVTRGFDNWASPGPLGTAEDDLCRFGYDPGGDLAIAVPTDPTLMFSSATAPRAEYVGFTIYGGPFCLGQPGVSTPPFFLSVDEDVPLIPHGAAPLEALTVTLGGQPCTLAGLRTVPYDVAPDPQDALGFVHVDAPKTLWLLFARS